MMDIKVKSARSLKSQHSIKSMKSTNDILGERPQDLDEFIENFCKKVACPCKIIVKKGVIPDERLQRQDSANKYRRISVAPSAFKKTVAPPPPLPPPDSYRDSDVDFTDNDQTTVTITALYDVVNRLAEVHVHNMNVPRMLIQIFGKAFPYYPQLFKMVLKKCRITTYTIYEITKILPLTLITDICLDGSHIPEGNYAMLLENKSKLTNLSLCRCSIDDEVCKQIASKLHYLEPAEPTLLALNLSSNRITDVGAKHLGEALRTNRHLRYLNLADNQIGDEGANHILHVLIDFPLTYDEIMTKRRRFMEYLRTRRDVYMKYYTQCEAKSVDETMSMASKKLSRKSTVVSQRGKSHNKKESQLASATVEDFMHVKAEMMANEIVGTFSHPFADDFTRLDADYFTHCVGNMVLCYLNLCYNDLSYLCLKKLQAVLFYQSVNKKSDQTGLMKVLIDGNPMPLSCQEMERISEMLKRNVINFSAKYIANKHRARKVSTMLEKR